MTLVCHVNSAWDSRADTKINSNEWCMRLRRETRESRGVTIPRLDDFKGLAANRLTQSGIEGAVVGVDIWSRTRQIVPRL